MNKRVPLPITGVMLAFFALGNLWQDTSPSFRVFCAIVGGALGIIFIIRLIKDPNNFKEEMNNPVMASVFGTFSMALMLISVYLKPFLGQISIGIWYLGIIIHIILIIYFTNKFILKIDMAKVFASYYIVYVGIVVASLSSPAFEKQALGRIFFYFGFVMMLGFLILINYRYIKYKDIKKPLSPLFIITSAPASLCLAGYVKSFMPPQKNMVIFFINLISSFIYL